MVTIDTFFFSSAARALAAPSAEGELIAYTTLMLESLDRQVSMAAWPPVWAPSVASWQEILYVPPLPPVYWPLFGSWPLTLGLPTLIPMPSRNPWSRSTSTVITWLARSSSMAMSALLPASLAASHLPSSVPAWVLSVA